MTFFGCAESLDLEQTQGIEDIRFFCETAQGEGSPLLDLGCGTGRLAIPLAGIGIEVVGIDISGAVLECFRTKLVHEPPEVRRRVKLFRADMRQFALKKKFRCAICSSNTLLLSGSEQAVGEALACVGSHMASGGIIVIDVAAINGAVKAALMQYPDGNVPDIVLDEGGARPLSRMHSARIIPGTNRFSVHYEYFDGLGNHCGKRREEIVLLTPEELLRILEQQRYEIVDTFGWYDWRRFSESDRKLLLVARKRE